MGDRNVPDRNKVMFGIPNVDTNVEVGYARDEAIKDLELKNQQLQDQITAISQPAVAAPTVIGGLAIEVSLPSGMPADGLTIGNGIYCVGNENAPKNTTCVFDRAGTLGIGSNVFIGMRQVDHSTTIGSVATEIIAYQPQTSTITSLGFPVAGATGVRIWQMIIVGSSLYLKQVISGTFSTIYRWSSGGWSTVSASGAGYMYKMVIGGVENLLVTTSISGVRRMGYIDPAFPTTMIGSTALPAGVLVAGKNAVLWRSDGYVALSASSPTWALAVPTMSYSAEFESGRVDVDFATGALGVLRRFGSPARFGIEVYDPTSGAALIYQSIWTTTGNEDDGEPRTTGIRLYFDQYFYMSGYLSEDYYEGTTGSTEYYPAIWISDGTTTQLTVTDPTGLGNANPPDPFAMVQVDRDSTGVIVAFNYGLEGTFPTASTSQIHVLFPA